MQEQFILRISIQPTVMCYVHLIAMHFFHPVVDVSTQGGCTITPINPTTLTAAGGVLASGTENVMIRCNCTDDDGMAIGHVRWYDPDGTRLLVSGHSRYVTGTPYSSNNANVLLVIPTFNDSYDGTYTCGRRSRSLPVGAPNATVELTISGKLTIVYKLFICA